MKILKVQDVAFGFFLGVVFATIVYVTIELVV